MQILHGVYFFHLLLLHLLSSHSRKSCAYIFSNLVIWVIHIVCDRFFRGRLSHFYSFDSEQQNCTYSLAKRAKTFVRILDKFSVPKSLPDILFRALLTHGGEKWFVSCLQMEEFRFSGFSRRWGHGVVGWWWHRGCVVLCFSFLTRGHEFIVSHLLRLVKEPVVRNDCLRGDKRGITFVPKFVLDLWRMELKPRELKNISSINWIFLWEDYLGTFQSACEERSRVALSEAQWALPTRSQLQRLINKK